MIARERHQQHSLNRLRTRVVADELHVLETPPDVHAPRERYLIGKNNNLVRRP
jgi:hypothetical protein